MENEKRQEKVEEVKSAEDANFQGQAIEVGDVVEGLGIFDDSAVQDLPTKGQAVEIVESSVEKIIASIKTKQD